MLKLLSWRGKLKEVKLIYTLEIDVRVADESLIIDYIVKHNGEMIKITTYIYDQAEVKSIDEYRTVRKKLKGRKTFNLLREHIIDILEHPKITPSAKYMLLTRYMKNSFFPTEAAKSIIGKLVDQVVLDKQKKEEKEDEIEKTEICALEGPATLPV